MQITIQPNQQLINKLKHNYACKNKYYNFYQNKLSLDFK